MKLRMPAEWELHSGTIMIWCERAGSWPYGGKYAAPIFTQIIRTIACGERVYLAVSPQKKQEVEEIFQKEISTGSVRLWEYAADDCWARDIGPTFVKERGLYGIDWAFNAWGGDFDGLYNDYARDDAFAAFAVKTLHAGLKSARPFVLEGGSIHSNGSGVILTTEECLLSKGRNPRLTKPRIEAILSRYLGAEKVVWLKRGIVGDETNGHVDNICAFSDKNTALLAWAEKGEQGKICRQNLEILQSAGFNVLKVPLPEAPVLITEEDLNGLQFAEGETPRTVGERLAASYINFYICNAGVLVPQFSDVNDRRALEVIASAFPDKKIIPIPARRLLAGGGNIHCLTQQIPM